jgi:prolyl-tRNA synthetase
VNEFALQRVLPGRAVRLFDDDDFAAHPELARGYVGPQHPAVKFVIADSSIRARASWISGANEQDHHVRNLVVDRDFTPTQWDEIVVVAPDDPCPSCGSPLRIDRGIEVGHVFQLGTKYSEALDARYTDEDGAQHPMVMGSYGIGITRIVAAVAEEHRDDGGLAWPAALAPYDVYLVVLPGKGDGAASVLATAEQLYTDLTGAGIDVLYDDRDASPGVKFADADLLGMPVRLTLGAKSAARGVVERRIRATGVDDELALADAVSTLKDDR